MTTYQILSVLGVPSLLASILISAFNCGKLRATNKIKKQEDERINKEKEHGLLMEGMVAILHNMIYQQGKEHIRVGEISIEDMKDYEYLYKSYHAMGGNGTGTEIYERVKDLPIRQERRNNNE